MGPEADRPEGPPADHPAQTVVTHALPLVIENKRLFEYCFK